MSSLIEMFKRRGETGDRRRLRRLLARHVCETNPNHDSDDSLAVHVLPLPDAASSGSQVSCAVAKDFLDVTFSLIASEPLPHRRLIVGIATGQVLSLFRAESGEARFLGRRLWQTKVELTEIVEGDEYSRMSARIR